MGVPHIVLLMGVAIFAHAAYDEHRGITSAQPPTKLGFLYPEVATRAEDPKRFRELMTYHWVGGAIFVAAGFIMLGIYRRADRSDPLSSDFAGSAALDELDRTLAKEAKKSGRRLR